MRTIIDIGGQDSKVIRIDDTGNVTNFVMNDKCAAGTGRFLELMARTLELSLEQMRKWGSLGRRTSPFPACAQCLPSLKWCP